MALGPVPPAAEGGGCVLYSLDGAAFARRSAFCLAEPARSPGEADALARLKRELALLEQHDAGWRRRASITLRELAEASQDRPGLWPRLPGLLTAWADELDRRPEDAGFTLEVTYPLDGRPAALCALLREALGMEDAALVEAPFSDALLLLDGPPPFADDALHTACRVTLGTRTCYAVPPLSPRLCAFLMDAADADDSCAPRLDLSGLRFLLAADGRSVEAQLCLRRRVQSSGKAAESAVTLRRTYTLGDALQTGAAIVLPAGEAPCVTVWPNVRLAPGLWKRYFLHIHQPRHLDAWALARRAGRRATCAMPPAASGATPAWTGSRRLSRSGAARSLWEHCSTTRPAASCATSPRRPSPSTSAASPPPSCSVRTAACSPPLCPNACTARSFRPPRMTAPAWPMNFCPIRCSCPEAPSKPPITA